MGAKLFAPKSGNRWHFWAVFGPEDCWMDYNLSASLTYLKHIIHQKVFSSLKKCKWRFLSKKPFSNKKASEAILILKHSDSIPCLMFVTVAGKTCNQNNISSQFSWESLLGKSSSPQFIYIFFSWRKKKSKNQRTNTMH